MGVTAGETYKMSRSLVKNLIHLVYSAKHRQPWLPDDVRNDLFAYQAGLVKALVVPFQAFQGDGFWGNL
jgi:hypothetical protein